MRWRKRRRELGDDAHFNDRLNHGHRLPSDFSSSQLLLNTSTFPPSSALSHARRAIRRAPALCDV